MNRRNFFGALLGIPFVGAAVLAKAAKANPKEPDIVLEGNVVVKGAFKVEGIQTGTALYAGDADAMERDMYTGMYCMGSKRSK
jgi:hypothetical protein